MAIAGAGASSTRQAHARSSDGGRDTRAGFDSARRHSTRVFWLRTALPLLALAMAASFGLYSWLVTPVKFTADFAESGLVDGKLVMANPKLEGFTNAKLPYRMVAERAIQEFGNMDYFDLENITAVVPMSDKVTAKISTAKGAYDNKAHSLVVATPMIVETSDGMTAKLQDARIDVAKGSLETDKPVEIRVDGSQINADSMRLASKDKIYVFENRVRMTVVPKDFQKKPDAGNAKQE